MHASVRKYRTTDIEALERKVEDEFIDQVKQVDGFIGYYVIDGRNGDVASVTVCKSADALLQITKLAGEWVRERAGDLVEGEPEVVAGEVRVRAEVEPPSDAESEESSDE
jgi:hypothetical protein